MIKNIVQIVLLLLIICSALQASEVDWMWRFGRAYFGTSPLAADSYGSDDSGIAQTWSTYIATYNDDNSNGGTGFYSKDMRAPVLMASGQSKVWTFWLWQKPSANIVLELSWGWSYPSPPAFDKFEYRLTYVGAADGITGGNIPVGTSVLLNEYQQGTWSFPVYRTDNGLTGYKFELTATVVPEPSSFLILIGGLAGLGGMVLRSRRA